MPIPFTIEESEITYQDPVEIPDAEAYEAIHVFMDYFAHHRKFPDIKICELFFDPEEKKVARFNLEAKTIEFTPIFDGEIVDAIKYLGDQR